jgi:23S rRNA (guanine2445-N2)-methyltransferase / 23S rRNA (guanine2069-N7)-methyltransferase
LNLLVSTTFGLEAIVKRELGRLGYQAQGDQPGWVRLQGDWSGVAELNLWLRTAERVYVELLQFPAPDFDTLYETLSAADFGAILPAEASFPVTARSKRSNLASLPAIQRTVKKALVNSLQRSHRVRALNEHGAVYPLEIVLLNDRATLLLNTSGPALHQRGYRSRVNPHLLKETIAAAMVMLSVWPNQFFTNSAEGSSAEEPPLRIPPRLLADPFCSDGVLPIEGAMIAADQPPGLFRNFAFNQWPILAPARWQQLRQAARERAQRNARERSIQILGSDRNPKKVELARFQAQKGGVESLIRWEVNQFENFTSRDSYGCLVSYPPWSDKEEDRYSHQRLYQAIPGVMQKLPSWSLFVLTPLPDFEKRVQRTADRRRKMHNHLRECVYYQYLGPRPAAVCERPAERLSGPVPPVSTPPIQPPVDRRAMAEHPVDRLPIPADPSPSPVGVKFAAPTSATSGGSASSPMAVTAGKVTIDTNPIDSATSKPGRPPTATPLFGGLTDKDRQQAILFHNRLVKQARHLRRWPKRGITCYRLYERDIPEIPLVVDRYENHLHLTEYERPHDRDLARHSAWLELMRETAATSLQIPLNQAFLKSRVMEESQRQYQKIDRLGDMLVVGEGGLKFYVNLTDYVDTGLFLDHRITRGRVAREGTGKDVLNLFAYTGSFSVYAAAAGARSTTTVDLSKTYLQWAESNFRLNDLPLDRQRFIQSDAISYLKQTSARSEPRFDLAIVDPPTYSNSKRTDQDWDVQRNHSELLQILARVLRPAGVVYFSTNFRRFKLNEEALSMYQIQEISHQTVPEDFRNRRIHRCWRMVRHPSLA